MEMKMKHTPGPWELLPVEDRSIKHLCPVDAEKMSILTVVEQDGVKFAAVYKDADARLIAAAPELLAAAQAALAYDLAIASCADDPKKMSSFCTASGDTLDSLYFVWQEGARAAIDKATGSTQ